MPRLCSLAARRPPCSKAEGGKCDGGEDKRRRFRTGGSQVSSTGVEGFGRVQSRLFGGLQNGLLGASQLLLVLLGGVGLGLVFGVEACLRCLEGGLGLVELALGGLDVLVGLRLRVLRGLFRLLSLFQGFSVLSSLLLFGFKILLRRTQLILRILHVLLSLVCGRIIGERLFHVLLLVLHIGLRLLHVLLSLLRIPLSLLPVAHSGIKSGLHIRYTLCRFIYLALRRAPLRGLGGLGYLSARPVHW